jgi:hypothetical protein
MQAFPTCMFHDGQLMKSSVSYCSIKSVRWWRRRMRRIRKSNLLVAWAAIFIGQGSSWRFGQGWCNLNGDCRFRNPKDPRDLSRSLSMVRGLGTTTLDIRDHAAPPRVARACVGVGVRDGRHRRVPSVHVARWPSRHASDPTAFLASTAFHATSSHPFSIET